eukprot:GHUV01018815.1.p1 GENE.GHUV01018815.1~~GHUV01018815.1.p1  ORF type:complete len:449 (+),score=59.15 GHUV01018815.1:982-2328(+)
MTRLVWTFQQYCCQATRLQSLPNTMLHGLRVHTFQANNRLLSRTRQRNIGSQLRSVQTSATYPGRPMAQANDPTNSFISQFRIEGSPEGPLAGMTLAVKDLFDIAGHKTAFGNATWQETHPTATHTAPPVQQLLAAGATVVGKTHMDELAYSLNGENVHYGTPVNVAAPGRIPGGSSSGSAAAVAAQQADIGLGSDTGGSVRVPASYCGLFGIRPTHGRISLEHARPLAPSFDTVGWFTRDPSLLQKVGQVLLSNPASATIKFKPRWLVAKDAFALAQHETSEAIYETLSNEKFSAVKATLGDPTELDIAAGLESEGLGKLELWMDVFRITQAYEIWQTHGAWITHHSPNFGPGTFDRFKMASGITEAEFTTADAQRQLIKQHMDQLLGTDGVLALPTAPGPAVKINTPASQLNDWRRSLLSLTCIAGLAVLPQVRHQMIAGKCESHR